MRCDANETGSRGLTIRHRDPLEEETPPGRDCVPLVRFTSSLFFLKKIILLLLVVYLGLFIYL